MGRRFRKVVIGTNVLYHADCLDVLEHLPMVDIALTSPPYNQFRTNKPGLSKMAMGLHVKALRAYDDQMPEPAYQRWLLSVFDKVMARTRGLMWVNHKIRYRNAAGIHPARLLPYPIHSEVIWDRANSTAIAHKRFMQSHEHIYGFGTPHYWNDMHDRLLTVWRATAASDPDHPCVLPAKVIQPLIVASCPIGGTVLDPFAGTGGTGKVAIRNSRRCILIEKDKKHFDRMVSEIEALYVTKRRA